MLLDFLRFNRKKDDKGSPFSWPVNHLQASSLVFDDRLCQRQTQPRSLSHLFSSKKRIKDSRQYLFRYTSPIIGYLETRPPSLLL